MSVMLANAGAIDRNKTDFYPTPSEVTRAILGFLSLGKCEKIWEPAAGQGHMVKVMEECGYTVVASDLHNDGHQDFLSSTKSCGDWIITNPPFSLAEKFIRHAHNLRPEGFAFLLKSQYWHATKRLALFKEIQPHFVLPLTWRPDFLFGAKAGAPTMEVLWTVWIKPYTPVATIYWPLRKGKDNVESFTGAGSSGSTILESH